MATLRPHLHADTVGKHWAASRLRRRTPSPAARGSAAPLPVAAPQARLSSSSSSASAGLSGSRRRRGRAVLTEASSSSQPSFTPETVTEAGSGAVLAPSQVFVASAGAKEARNLVQLVLVSLIMFIASTAASAVLPLCASGPRIPSLHAPALCAATALRVFATFQLSTATAGCLTLLCVPVWRIRQLHSCQPPQSATRWLLHSLARIEAGIVC